MLTSVSIGRMSVQWCLAFKDGNLAYTTFCIYKSMCNINSKWSCASLFCRKVIVPKPNLSDYHVMFTSQQPNDCDFLWGVCLHASLKAAGLSVNFSNVTTSKKMWVCRSTLLHNVQSLAFWFNNLVTRMLQTCCIGSLVPRPPPFLPSICVHSNTRERKTRLILSIFPFRVLLWTQTGEIKTG